jgi:hypothetical protein
MSRPMIVSAISACGVAKTLFTHADLGDLQGRTEISHPTRPARLPRCMRFRRLVDPRTAMADSVRDPVFPIWAAAAVRSA